MIELDELEDEGEIEDKPREKVVGEAKTSTKRNLGSLR